MLNTIWMRIHSIDDGVVHGIDVMTGYKASIMLPEVGATSAEALRHEHSLLKQAVGSNAFGAEAVFRINGDMTTTDNHIHGTAEHVNVLSQPNQTQSDSKQTTVLEGPMRMLFFGRAESGKNRLLETAKDLREAAEATIHGRHFKRSPLLAVLRQYGLNSTQISPADDEYFRGIEEILEKNCRNVYGHGVNGIGFGVALRVLDMKQKEIIGYREINATYAENENAGSKLFESNRSEIAAIYHAARRGENLLVEAIPTLSYAMPNESCVSFSRRLLANEVLLQQAAKLASQDNKVPTKPDGKPVIPGERYFPNIAGQAVQVQTKENRNGRSYAFVTGNLHLYTQPFSIAKAPSNHTNPTECNKLWPRRRTIMLEDQERRVREAAQQPRKTEAQVPPQVNRDSVVVSFPKKPGTPPEQSPVKYQQKELQKGVSMAADSIQPISNEASRRAQSAGADHNQLKTRETTTDASMQKVSDRSNRLLAKYRQQSTNEQKIDNDPTRGM